MLQQLKPQVKASRRRARIEPLDTLPVFFKLQDVPVLVFGGTAAAAWKAELLEAAGADVTWAAEDFGHDAMAVLQAPRLKGRIHGRLQAWQDLDLGLYRFAVVDLPEQQAAQFVKAAEAANLLYNVIDQTEFCHFQFGSIVNRSPLVIGINTNGAVPVLAQVMRQKIEDLIPKHLQTWLRCAAKCRSKVLTALSDVKPRRAFWRKFVAQGFEDKGSPCALMAQVADFVDRPGAPRDQPPKSQQFLYHPGQAPDPALIAALQTAERVEVKGDFPEVLGPYLRRETEIEISPASGKGVELQVA